MNKFGKQLGLSTASGTAWQSFANAGRNGGVRLRAIPAHPAFDRIDFLATNSGEPMT